MIVTYFVAQQECFGPAWDDKRTVRPKSTNQPMDEKLGRHYSTKQQARTSEEQLYTK